MKKMILTALTTTFLAGFAQAALVPVPPEDLLRYKSAALASIQSQAYSCKIEGDFLPYGFSSYSLQQLINAASEVFVDMSNTSPALIFRYKRVEKYESPSPVTITDIYIDVTADQKKILDIRGETKRRTSVNKGTLVQPIMVQEYLTVGTLKSCKL